MIRFAVRPSPRHTLIWFGFRQALKGAIIIGLFAGGMMALQGVAYQKAYSTVQQQEKISASLASAPGLGFIYGDPANLKSGTPGYMVYRELGFASVVVAVWALIVVTKMLRGAEEDGRWEVIEAGAISSLKATAAVCSGFVYAWLLALVISFAITLLAVKGGSIHTTIKAMWLLNVGMFMPGFVFVGAGIFVSQLAQSRIRALLYGLVPLGALFLVRGTGNTDQGLHWLLYATPFGWNELINPVRGPDTVWLLPLFGLGLLLAATGLLLTRRDYGEGVIAENSEARSHFGFLRYSWQLALRQNSLMITGMAVGAVAVVSLITGLSHTAAGALKASGGLSKAVNKLSSGSSSLETAFIGAGILFMIMVLLVMSVNLIGSIRRDEARQYLDNILVMPQRRSTWLVSRLLLAFGIVLAISLLGGFALYLIAGAQHIPLDFIKVMATCICAVGTIGFLIGFGGLCYGLWPRIAFIAMFAVIGWSFLVILLSSAAKLNTVLLHSSLFQYTNFNLAKWPDWATFGWMMLLGVVLAALGVAAFDRRDIVVE